MVKLRGGENFPIYHGAKPSLLRIGGELRHIMTPAERLLWQQLRKKNLSGFKFRRQHPFDEIVLDFYCYEAKLSIEIDGNVHKDAYQKERDKERTIILKRSGVTELRFTNSEIENKLDEVILKIQDYLEKFKKQKY